MLFDMSSMMTENSIAKKKQTYKTTWNSVASPHRFIFHIPLCLLLFRLKSNGSRECNKDSLRFSLRSFGIHQINICAEYMYIFNQSIYK